MRMLWIALPLALAACSSYQATSFPITRNMSEPSDHINFAAITASSHVAPSRIRKLNIMIRQTKDEPLPVEMQGRWVDIDDEDSELIITGGKITCFGKAIEYDYKLVGTQDGALTVSLKVENAAQDDDFHRSNVTELVITPDKKFHAYNAKFVSEFIKAQP